MPEGLGARLAIENGFLILLAVGAAVAELDPLWIVVVMAIGWFLVALVELLAWRARPAYAWTPMPASPFEEAPPAVYEPVPHAPPVEPDAEYPPAPFEPEPVAVEPAELAPEPEPEESAAPEEAWPATPAATEYEFAFSRPDVSEAPAVEESPAEEAPALDETVVTPREQRETGEQYTTTLFQRPEARRQRIRLEPLQPRPKRRWFGRSGEREPEPSPPPDEEQG